MRLWRRLLLELYRHDRVYRYRLGLFPLWHEPGPDCAHCAYINGTSR